MQTICDDQTLRTAIIAFVNANVPDAWNGEPVNFRSTCPQGLLFADYLKSIISDWSAQTADAALATAPP